MMASIAVVHPQFSVQGGAEFVALTTLEALQDDHDVTLLTAAPTEISDLNRLHGTRVEDITIRFALRGGRALRLAVGDRYMVMQFALLNRRFRRLEDRFDLVVSTFNEFASSKPTICYFHHPIYDKSELPDRGSSAGPLRRGYGAVARRIAGVTDRSLQSSLTFANSDWSGQVIERTYGVDPTTLYPPVNVAEFVGRRNSQDEQEPGFVCVGRLTPDKRVVRVIEIIDAVRQRGHDIHVHVVGPPFDSEYSKAVNRAAASRDYVHIEGAVSRDRLVELLTSHRYGIHGKQFEHFGIAIVEMIAAGMLPFVPDYGGQREILDDADELRYDNREEAVELIDQVLSDPSLESRLLERLASVPDRYEPEGFRTRIREQAEQLL